MCSKISKYLYDDYIQELGKEKRRVCLITEIRDVDRCNYEVFQNLYDSLQPLKAFVLYNNDLINNNLEKCENTITSFYSNDNKGNAEYIGEIIKYLDDVYTSLELVFIDASAINKETLLELLFVIRDIVKIKTKIEVVYITPNDYGTYNFDNYKVPYSLSFSPGKQLMENKTALILISGYEEDGELALIRYVDPEYLYIGLAEPSTEESFKSQNISNINKIIKEFSKDEGIKIEEFNCSGNDIEKCCEDLEKLLKEDGFFENRNVFIAPMNNKLTTIASYLIWERYPDIQIVNIRGERRSDSVKESGRNHIFKFEI